MTAPTEAATVPFTSSASTKTDPSGTLPCLRVHKFRAGQLNHAESPARSSERHSNWEAANGDKKQSQGQSQRKAQETPSHQGRPAQKDQDGQKKAGEKGAGPASITQEFQADREGRRQADAHQPAGAACRSHTEPDRATHPPWRSVSASSPTITTTCQSRFCGWILVRCALAI
jgi:hypothetical protein